MKTFKRYVAEDWKRAALMGAAATAAGAATAAAIGFPVAAGAAIAGGHYALSRSGLAQDLLQKIRKRRKKLAEQNDNPDPKDIKNAKVDAARRHMSSKTDDEREFYKRKLKALK